MSKTAPTGDAHYEIEIDHEAGTATLSERAVVDATAAVATMKLTSSSNGAIVNLFKSIDADGSGDIASDDFAKMAGDDEEFGNEGWNKLETHFDVDGDGSITMDEFRFGLKGFGMKVAAMLWVFYTSKILDFFDTIIMVARGTWRQFSFLHVYHHTSIFMIYWLNLNSGYDGDIYYTIVLNGFIHFIMYAYYFMSIFNIPLAKYIRPLVTNAQLIQFVTMMSQAGYLLVAGCAYPQRITGMYLVYIFSLFLLFNNFKSKTYAKAKGDSKKSK